MIKKLKKNDIGKWVYYVDSFTKEKQQGKIKNFNNKTKIAWVVYKCNNNWDSDHWKDYTAEPTRYKDLKMDK